MIEIANQISEHNHATAVRVALAILQTLSIASENQERQLSQEQLATQLDIVSDLIKVMDIEFQQCENQ